MTETHVPTDAGKLCAAVEILDDPGDSMVHNDFTINPDVGDMIGLAPHEKAYHLSTRTIRMRDRVLETTDGAVVASFTGMSTTVTKMTDPHDGSLSLFITFNYLLTSHGYHTGSILNGLYFLNRDGGIMYSWGLPGHDFTLDCGWSNHQIYVPWTEPRLVSWFDDWRKVSYRWREGTVWGC